MSWVNLKLQPAACHNILWLHAETVVRCYPY